MPRFALLLLLIASAVAVAEDAPRILVTFADPGINSAVGAGPGRPGYRPRSSTYLVSVSVRRAANRLARDFNLNIVDEWPIVPLKVHCLVFEVDADRSLDELLTKLREQPDVESAQRMNTFEVQGSGVDPYAGLQHNIATLGLAEAHSLTRGEGASVTIIDTGADFRHPELAAAIRTHRDFAGGGNFTSEPHGTAVAGLIGAASDNGFGIVGVAPGARLDILRACWYPEGRTAAVCDSFTLAKALTYAIESDSNVINLSLGGPTDPLLSRLLRLALDRGILVVAAASQQAGFPADVPGVIVVAAEGGGKDVLLHAPGVDILVPVPGGGFDYASGSSLSAAQVTGVIALMIAQRPGIGHDDVTGLLAASGGEDGGSVNACRVLAKMLDRPACQDMAATRFAD